MPYGYFLLLTLIKKFQGERTVSGIYHLLKGKRSAQTIQDSTLFHVEPFFHLLEALPREDFDRIKGACVEHGWLSSPENRDPFHLTAQGEVMLQHLKTIHVFPDGLTCTDHVYAESSFWLGLQLMVQTLSELAHQQKTFLPVTRRTDVTSRVRRILQCSRQDRQTLARELGRELQRLLEHCPPIEADMLTAQFSGFGTGGLTLEQIAWTAGHDLIECRILTKSAIRRLLHLLATEPAAFPILSRLADLRLSTLSASAARTLGFVRQGLPLKTIAKVRHLSHGTIEDHLVEIALKMPHFDCGSYLPEPVALAVHSATSQLQTRRLKPIKRLLQNRASYFQIRLALALSARAEGDEPS